MGRGIQKSDRVCEKCGKIPTMKIDYAKGWTSYLCDCGCTIKYPHKTTFIPRSSFVKNFKAQVCETCLQETDRFFKHGSWEVRICGCGCTLIKDTKKKQFSFDDSKRILYAIDLLEGIFKKVF